MERIRYGEPGNQLVEIDHKLAYRWGGDVPLEVGEKVVLPGNWVRGNEPWTGEVTALGTTYDGPVVSVLRRAD